MNNRYTPNEVACPVPLELLSLLLRSDAVRIAEIADALPALQRAALAAFCFTRCHMRDLSLALAARCEEPALREMAGTAGEVLFERSRDRMPLEAEPRIAGRRKVTLATFAA